MHGRILGHTHGGIQTYEGTASAKRQWCVQNAQCVSGIAISVRTIAIVRYE